MKKSTRYSEKPFIEATRNGMPSEAAAAWVADGSVARSAYPQQVTVAYAYCCSGSVRYCDCVNKSHGTALMGANEAGEDYAIVRPSPQTNVPLGWTLISDAHLNALVDGMSEILATTTGSSNQPMIDIIEGVAKEIEAAPAPIQGGSQEGRKVMEDDTIAMNSVPQPERGEDWRQNCQYLIDIMDNEGFEFSNLCEDDQAGLNDIRALLDEVPIKSRQSNLAVEVEAKIGDLSLEFEGDLDKWMKIIGAGITGSQPEAYAIMDAACEELVRLRLLRIDLWKTLKLAKDHSELEEEVLDIVDDAIAKADPYEQNWEPAIEIGHEDRSAKLVRSYENTIIRMQKELDVLRDKAVEANPASTILGSGIDAQIERILADNTPGTEADGADILVCELGIAKGRNAMLVKALQVSIDVMNAYKHLGYGDEVYMDTLCRAIREGEKAVSLHAETPPPQTREASPTSTQEQEGSDE